MDLKKKIIKKLINVLVLSILTLSWAFLTPDSIYGQSYRTFRSEMEEIIQEARWRIGPFRIYPRILFRDIGYDDNVYRKREEDGPISDYTATISPEIRVYLLFRNWLILSFSENPEYVYFVKEQRERSFNNSYSPSVKLIVFNRFVLSGNYRYRRGRRRATSEFDVRADYKNKNYNVSFFYETARETSFGFSGHFRKISYEDIVLPEEDIYLARALNRKEIEGNFEFYYKIFSESFFFINGGYTEYIFESDETQWRNSYSYQIYSGIVFPIFGRIRGNLSLGYKTLIPKRIMKQGFSGIVGNTRLDFRISRFALRFQYIRDARFSFWTNNIFFLEDMYGAGISFYLFRFLRLDYNLRYGKLSYTEPTIIRLPNEEYIEIKRQDIYRTHTMGFAVRVIKNTGIGIRLDFWERESNDPRWMDRKRWFVGGYITYEFW